MAAANDTTTGKSMPKNTIGANRNGSLVNCHVDVAGDLALGERDHVMDKVQAFRFEEFHTIAGEPLTDYMASIRHQLDSDDAEINEKALLELHEIFLPIVDEIIAERGLYSKELLGVVPILKMTGAAQMRHASDQYACYLHNDIWLSSRNCDDKNQDKERQLQQTAMINVWFVLNDVPPTNQLVFFETVASNTSQSHMLHGSADEVEGNTIIYDDKMSWGRFYVFVSGQEETCDRVLLHGAMNVHSKVELLVKGEKAANPDIVRRSVEMRYSVLV